MSELGLQHPNWRTENQNGKANIPQSFKPILPIFLAFALPSRVKPILSSLLCFLRLEEMNQEVIFPVVSQKQGHVYWCQVFQLGSHMYEWPVNTWKVITISPTQQPTRMAKIKDQPYQMLVKVWSSCKSHILLEGVWDYTTIVENWKYLTKLSI